MKINKKKFIYLISPNKILNSFYSDLKLVLKTKKVSFFQLRLKNYSIKKKIESDVENFISTEIEWLPLNKVSSKGDNAEDIKKLLDLLDDEDDVQRVYSNFREED